MDYTGKFRCPVCDEVQPTSEGTMIKVGRSTMKVCFNCIANKGKIRK